MIYLGTTTNAIGALLTPEDEKVKEKPIYYVSRQLHDIEKQYPASELACLTLVYASQRLCHYFLSHKLQLMVKSDPIRFLLTKPILSGRLVRWLLQLSQFNITCVVPKAIKSQAVIDRVTMFSGQTEEEVEKELPSRAPESVMSTTSFDSEERIWTLFFDGSTA